MHSKTIIIDKWLFNLFAIVRRSNKDWDEFVEFYNDKLARLACRRLGVEW